MNKIPMCRICLVENVRMYIVNDKDLQELYEKLTDIPFVTEDSRPMLACFICCTKLKQCCQLQRKCLQAEELFAQMMNELNPSVNRGQLKYSSGLIVTPVENISIVDVSHVECIAVKEELPAVCERPDDVIEPEVEYFKYELELELLNNSYSDAEDIPAQQSKPDPEYDVPLIEIKTEVEEEQEVSRTPGTSDTTQLELELLNNSCSDVEDIPAQQSESDPEYDVPLVEIKTEVEEEQEVSSKKRRASDTTPAAVTKTRKLHTRGNELEDVITENQKKNEESVKKVTRNTQNYMSTLSLNTQDPLSNTAPRVNISVIDTSSDTNSRNINLPIHTGGAPYKCNICQYSSKNKTALTKHIRIHTGEKPYKCEECQRCFSQKGNLVSHIRTHTGEKPYKCEECGHCFSEKSKLTSHILLHTGEKPFKCEECGLCFNKKRILTRHIRTHTNDKPYKCEECGHCFSEKCYLTSHIRTHTGEKPFKCEECGLCFVMNNSLTRHIRRTHTNEKPYKCEECGLCFSEKCNLTSHIRTHTGEKPFKCEECGICFNKKSTLICHIRTHTGEKPYKCEECQCGFSRKNILTKHILIRHAGVKSYK